MSSLRKSPGPIMPIYECHCPGCDLIFEVLAPLSRAGRRHPCPRCRRPAPRIASAFAIASGPGARETKTEAGAAGMHAASKTPPLCLRHPNVPMLCHMEPKAAARWLARSNGCVAEYDDKQGAREDLRRKRGLPPELPPPPSAHSHGHGSDFRRHQADGAAEASHNHSHGADHAAPSNAHPQTAPPKRHKHTHAHGGHTHSH
jgi:putative FmdB family regulatory protein